MEEFAGCTVEIVTDRSGCQLPLVKADGVYVPFPVEGEDYVSHVNFGKVSNLHVRDDDVFFIGYTRSGTHWIYEMVGMLLNGNTDAIDKNKERLMMDIVPIDELEKMPSPRLLNNHFRPKHVSREILMSKKIIYLLRNPKDVFVSDYYFHRSFNPPKIPGMDSYKGKFSDWLELCLQGKVSYGSWFDFVRAWEDLFESDKTIDPIIIHYEDMKRNTVGVLKRVTERLGLDRSEEFLQEVSVACQLKKMRENNDKRDDSMKNTTPDGSLLNYRKGVIGDWKTHFTVADNEKFEEVYREKMKGSKLKFVFE